MARNAPKKTAAKKAAPKTTNPQRRRVPKRTNKDEYRPVDELVAEQRSKFESGFMESDVLNLNRIENLYKPTTPQAQLMVNGTTGTTVIDLDQAESSQVLAALLRARGYSVSPNEFGEKGNSDREYKQAIAHEERADAIVPMPPYVGEKIGTGRIPSNPVKESTNLEKRINQLHSLLGNMCYTVHGIERALGNLFGEEAPPVLDILDVNPTNRMHSLDMLISDTESLHKRLAVIRQAAEQSI